MIGLVMAGPPTVTGRHAGEGTGGGDEGTGGGDEVTGGGAGGAVTEATPIYHLKGALTLEGVIDVAIHVIPAAAGDSYKYNTSSERRNIDQEIPVNRSCVLAVESTKERFVGEKL